MGKMKGGDWNRLVAWGMNRDDDGYWYADSEDHGAFAALGDIL